MTELSASGPERPDGRPAPWGLWATLALAAAVAAAFLGAQGVVFGGYAAFRTLRDPGLDVLALAAELQTDGTLLAAALCVSAPIGIALSALCGWSRGGWSAAGYLALVRIELPTLLRWLGCAVLFAAASDGLTLLLGRPVVPEFVAKAYATAAVAPLLWFAFVVAAPAFEEVFFRGFLFRGLEASRLGGRGAVAGTALAFGVMHLQYDLYGMATAVAIGVLLGVARLRTGSTLASFAMHAFMNLIATLEAGLLG
ncbi:MAG: type II CAAX endopeptidase family protein [Elusimicrobiota bacterium]